MGDILSAASLLLAILTTLYVFNYPSIKEAIDFPVDQNKVNNREKHNKSKIVWRTKLLPLLITSIVLTVIFIPEFLKILTSSVKVIFSDSPNKYDTVKASYLAVTAFIAVLTLSIVWSSFKLLSKKKELTPPPTQKV